MFGNLLKKELKELLNLYSILFITILAAVYGMLGQAIGSAEKSMPKTPTIALINKDNSQLGQFVGEFFQKSAKIVYTGDSKDQAMRTLEASKGIAVIVIPRNFSTSILSGIKEQLEVIWIAKGTGLMDNAGHSALYQQLEALKRVITQSLLQGGYRSIDPDVLLDPFQLKEETTIRNLRVQGPPSLVIGTIQSRSSMIPVLVLMLIMMSGMTVISSMGMEKENRTLETLLTLPVSRNHIVLSKIVASAVTGLILASIYMVGMVFYMRPFSFQIPDEMKQMLSLGGMDYALFGLSLFFALMAGLSLFVVLASFAKDYRSSQGLAFPVTMLGIVPMLLTMFKDYVTLPFALKVLVFLIPFTHPMIAMKELMLNNQSLVILGILYSAAFSVGFVALATRIYNSERILVGKTKSKKEISWPILQLILRKFRKV